MSWAYLGTQETSPQKSRAPARRARPPTDKVPSQDQPRPYTCSARQKKTRPTTKKPTPQQTAAIHSSGLVTIGVAVGLQRDVRDQLWGAVKVLAAVVP